MGESWHLIGSVAELKSKPCRKVFTKDGSPLALFHLAPDSFFLTLARCPHAGGPLDQGDIEEIAGKVQVVCPLHFYTFDLRSGHSATGLKLQTFETKQEDGNLYGLTPNEMSLTRF